MKICLHSGFSFVLLSLLVLKDPIVSSCARPQSRTANSLRFVQISSSVGSKQTKKKIASTMLLNALEHYKIQR